MKKIYILICFVITFQLAGVASAFTRDVAETKAIGVKQQVANIKAINQRIMAHPTAKSVVAKSKKLEKITLADGGSKEFTYNDQGLTVSYKNNKYDEASGVILLSEHNTIGYDSHGNKTLQLFNSLVEGQMTNVEKDEFEYDAQNRETLHIFWEYSFDLGKIIKNTKTVTSYQTDLIKIEEYSWDESAQTWNLESKSELEKKNEQLVKATYYSKSEETGEIIKSMVMEFTYNANGSHKQTLTKAIDQETGQLVDFMKTEITYDSNGNEILSVDSMFEPESGAWMEWSKTKSIFNASNVLTSDEYYSLNWMTFQLTISEKHEYSYTNNKLTQELVWEDEDMDGEISQSYKFEFAYDNSIDIDEVALPDSWIEHNDFTDIWGEFQFSFGALSNAKWYQWDYETSSLKKYRDATYHYSNGGSGVAVNTLGKSGIKVGPNPFNETLSVSLSESTPATVSVYNVAGQKVFNASVKEDATISTVAWEKGIYMVHLTTESGKHEMAKLVKR